MSTVQSTWRRGVLMIAAAALLITALPLSSSWAGPAFPPISPSCPRSIDPATFAPSAAIQRDVKKIANFGLRLPASPEHNQMLDWLDGQLAAIPGLQVRDDPFTMTRWLPTTKSRTQPGLDLGRAAKLGVVVPGMANKGRKKVRKIQTAGALVYSQPTKRSGVKAKIVYIPNGTAITAANAKGKFVLRDVPSAPLPYAALVAVSHFVTPDLLTRATGSYDRPYVTTGLEVEADQTKAAQVGARGIIHAFNVPTAQVRGYFDPHTGTLQHIPGVWIGAKQRERLKRLATRGARIQMKVKARIDEAMPTRNVIATLPGQSTEKISLVTNTDGNTAVQENSGAALLALADYFAKLPLDCRPKTIEFAFTSAHLAYAWDGVPRYASSLEAGGTQTSFVFVVEHLGTKEILPVPNPHGSGQRLEYTGKSEPYAWFAPSESPALSTALSAAVAGRGTDGSAVLRGLDVPKPGRFPTSCNFGGLANFSNNAFIPTIGGISGPWSLWAPSFGLDAIDFTRMWQQTLTVGDTVLSLADVPSAVIDGAYPAEKALVAGGAETCPVIEPAKVAPR